MNTSPEGEEAPKPGWWKQRTALEICLLLISVALLVGTATLAILLGGANAPLEPAWGSVAEWAGVAVTFFGFVGAFGALMLQRRSVSIQVDQHLADLSAKERQAADRSARAIARAKVERERYAEALRLFISTDFDSDGWSDYDSIRGDQLNFSVKVKSVDNLRFTNVELHVSDIDDLTVTSSEKHIAEISRGDQLGLWWEAETARGEMTGFFGDTRSADAMKWLAERVSVDFTDANGVRWRKHGNQSFEEIEPQNVQNQESPEM